MHSSVDHAGFHLPRMERLQDKLRERLKASTKERKAKKPSP